MTELLPIPVFETEADERAFWESHDSTAYIDWSKAERARFPNLKPSAGKPIRRSRPDQPR